MNVLYVSLSYVPSRRASSVHVMRMCSAFARAGNRVRLIAKRSEEPSATGVDDFAFYGVEPTFELHKFAYPNRRGGALVFGGAVLSALVRFRRSTDLVFSRDVIGAYLAAMLRIPLIFELHEVPTHPLIRWQVKQIVAHSSLRGLVVISEALRRDLELEKMLPLDAPVVVAHDAADPPGPWNASSRAKSARPRIGYVGSLYPGRGIDLLLELAARLPEYDVEIVGGTEADLAKWRAHSLPRNLTFVGFVPPALLAERYRSFDVLLMPTSRTKVQAALPNSDISRWTSPMKMFEYMASGVPIVASDLPVLQEVLRHEHNALIAGSDDLGAWEKAIRQLVAEDAFAKRLALQAYEDLCANHTWDRRVSQIFNRLRSVGQL